MELNAILHLCDLPQDLCDAGVSLTGPSAHLAASSTVLAAAANSAAVRCSWARRAISSITFDEYVTAERPPVTRSHVPWYLDPRKASLVGTDLDRDCPLARQLQIPFMWYLKSRLGYMRRHSPIHHGFIYPAVVRARSSHPFSLATLDRLVPATFAPLPDCVGLRSIPEGLALPFFFLHVNDIDSLRSCLEKLYKLYPALKTDKAPLHVWARVWLDERSEVRSFLELASKIDTTTTFPVALALAALTSWNLDAFDAILRTTGKSPEDAYDEVSDIFGDNRVLSRPLFYTIWFLRGNVKDVCTHVRVLKKYLIHGGDLGTCISGFLDPVCDPELFYALYDEFDAPYVTSRMTKPTELAIAFAGQRFMDPAWRVANSGLMHGSWQRLLLATHANPESCREFVSLIEDHFQPKEYRDLALTAMDLIEPEWELYFAQVSNELLDAFIGPRTKYWPLALACTAEFSLYGRLMPGYSINLFYGAFSALLTMPGAPARLPKVSADLFGVCLSQILHRFSKHAYLATFITETLELLIKHDVAWFVAWVLPQAMRHNLTMINTYLEFPDFVLDLVTQTPGWREAAATISEPRKCNPVLQLIYTAAFDACAAAVDSKSCRYFEGARALSMSRRLPAIWDVEDMRDLGLKSRGCPYFASRTLAETADLVLCPYNYLLDPQIRASMGIKLDNDIVVLDEAHNVEDVAREAAGSEIEDIQLAALAKELADLTEFFGEMDEGDVIAHYVSGVPDYAVLLRLVEALQAFLADHVKSFQEVTFDHKLNVVNPDTFVRHLGTSGVTLDTLVDVQAALETVSACKADQRENSMVQVISDPAFRLIGSLLLSLGNLFDPRFTADFHVIAVERIVRANTGKTNGRSTGAGSRRSNNSTITDCTFPCFIMSPGSDLICDMREERKHKMALWCMNPGVTFSALGNQAHSVLLMSGTLSPMGTFASELQADFPIRLEADHVIQLDQTWVGAVNSPELIGTYQQSEALEYQDAIGWAVVELARHVPHGILVFAPSYAFLDKLINRWRLTGAYDALERAKKVFTEPRAGKEAAFEDAINGFYEAVEGSSQRERDVGHWLGGGALMFGVYRGKVSEGIDFSNNRARAVVCIGIPYPSVMDKKAYRAINQTLGRCIRHRNDWGALVLLDRRFATPKAQQGLSKWVRPRITVWNHLGAALENVVGFLEYRGVKYAPLQLPTRVKI
ncbi:hypothetical protein H9P43_009144 [Blastocladiella emersonii ATCC 22665]|nr:hypothetical protein H9P43_009144 [Blastocladiella emersonii ATCC 22665]